MRSVPRPVARPTGRARPVDDVAAPFAPVLEAARAGDRWAVERLYRGALGAVTTYLGGHGVDDADGLANEVMHRALRRLDTFTGDEDAFRAWIFTIARNAMIDDRRRAGRRVRLELVDASHLKGPDAVDAEALVLEQLGTDRVEQVLARLAPDQRDVLLLRILGDLTIEQVATAVGKRVGAVKALQRRGVAALARLLASEPYLFGADQRWEK